MKFHLFEAFTKEEAQEYLDEFLIFGKERGIKILEETLHFTIDLDFTIESLPKVIKNLLPRLETVSRKPDPNVPEFIRNTADYHKNLFDFDEKSNLILLAAAYYLGETFVWNFEKLRWSTGKTDYIEANMPVVKTFKYGIEMAPIMIMENIFGRIISGMGDLSGIDTAIAAWHADVP